MHANQLVELATVTSLHTPSLLLERPPLCESLVEEYWNTSRRRLDNWTVEIKQCAGINSRERERAHSHHRLSTAGYLAETCPSSDQTATMVKEELNLDQCERLLVEIILSEPLVRVWSAIMTLIDDPNRGYTVAPIVRCVLLGQSEHRDRVLSLIQGSASLPESFVQRILGLWRHTTRWTDLLIGYISAYADAFDFSEDQYRAHLFAKDFQSQLCRHGRKSVETSLHAATRRAFPPDTSCLPFSSELNRSLASNLASFLAPNGVDGAALLRSVWLSRLTTITDDTEPLIEELMACCSVASDSRC